MAPSIRTGSAFQAIGSTTAFQPSRRALEGDRLLRAGANDDLGRRRIGRRSAEAEDQPGAEPPGIEREAGVEAGEVESATP